MEKKETGRKMGRDLCLSCFRLKGKEKDVCPYCGYREDAPPAQAYQLKPGTILEERYIIGRVLGYGGFGITYHAYDTTLSIPVAVKEFYPSGLVNRAEGESRVGIFSGDKEKEYHLLLDRFIDEARSMALFAEEKDIVNVLAYFEANGTAYIIMEYIEGELLKNNLRNQGRMQAGQACKYICALLTALQKIHDKEIIHRDISPDNIFLTGSDTVKVFDFGAAKFQDKEFHKNQSVIVKPGFAPPEQYRSKVVPDKRMDIYAAGAVFYQMLTGERPVESLERNLEDKLSPPSRMGAKVSKEMDNVVMKALALEPSQRYSTAMEFKEAVLNGEKKKRKWW